MLQRPKYNANKTEIDGIKFDSKVEGDYYLYLKNHGIQFEHHPRFILQEKFKHDDKRILPIIYEADFSFVDGLNNKIVVDIKGMPTPDAKIKRKMFMFHYQHIELKRLVKYKNEWVDYFDNQKRIKKNKKDKKELENI